MSLLGNDFVPHSMTINIRLGGHDLLIGDLASMANGGLRLTRVDPESGLVVNVAGLRHIVRTWATAEDEDMLRGIQRKYKMRQPPARSEAERAMMGVQNLPLEWAAENCLWSPERGVLHEDWRDRYYAESAPAALEDIRARCEEWCKGLQWILDYYTGQRPVSRTWFYPWSHPPLWADLGVFLEKGFGDRLTMPPETGNPVQPQEQLTIVLPMESWGLIRDARLRAVAAHMPAFWPKKFEFESLGKRWMWECEPRIPILTPARLRAVTFSA
jgi:5'-3' exonuclease